MTAVGVAGAVGVVLEEEHLAADAFLAEALLSALYEPLENALAGLVVDPRSRIESHSGVAYSGWLPTSR